MYVFEFLREELCPTYSLRSYRNALPTPRLSYRRGLAATRAAPKLQPEKLLLLATPRLA